MIKSSMFGMAASLSKQSSSISRESAAVLIDLSSFMVITAGDTEQFAVALSAFSRCPFSINFSSSCRIVFWR